MQIDQSTEKTRSVKQLRLQLSVLTKELHKTTEQLQLLELYEGEDQFADGNTPEEISELIRKQNKISCDIITVKKRIQKLTARTILKAELVVLPILVVLLFYGFTNQYLPNSSDIPISMKTRYFVENLQGQVDSTPKYWDILQGTSLTVSIVNPDHLSEEKINVIKNAILSTKQVYSDTSFFGVPTNDQKLRYYGGWEGALNTIQNTEFTVPNRFNVVESATYPGQIVITLSHLKDPDGYAGYTRLVVDHSQILKSFITIYDADKLSDSQLAAIVRHEFGHALGLPHANNPQDLMHPIIQTNYPYISQCDINAVRSLYDGQSIDSNCSVQ